MSGGSAPLVRSPLLIGRGARSAGGSAGRRVELFAVADGYRVRTSGDVERDALAGDPLSAVQHFNQAVREAARAGLTSAPEPTPLTIDALVRAERR